MRSLVCAMSAACVSLAAAQAAASPDYVLDGASAELSGKQVFRRFHLMNGAKVTVPRGTDASPEAGKLYVIAHEIVIDETSTIDGVAAGWPGRPNGNGLPESSGGKGAVEGSDPGGGGAYGAKGGAGVFVSGCVAAPFAEGGKLFTDFGGAALGSSGAAAGSKDGDEGGRGGAGGGMVDLRASRIRLWGRVLVDGEAGQVYAGDDASGGGSGGGIWLQSSLLEASGGLLRAAGGIGGRSSKDEGGSGSGGRIYLRVDALPAGLVTSVAAGASVCASARGGDGVVDVQTGSACMDLDEDGVVSEACGGEDCDDSDGAVLPGGVERCNGEDDDCDGEVDEGASAACVIGECVGGECVEPDAGAQDAGQDSDDGGTSSESGVSGSEAGVDGGARPKAERYEFRGGCSSSSGNAGGGWLTALVVGLLAGRRRIASSRGKERRTGEPRLGQVA